MLALWYVHRRRWSHALVDEWAADANYKVVKKTVVRVRSPHCCVFQVTLANQNGDIRRALVQCDGWRPKLDVFWAYSIHIRRQDGSAITLDQWRAAVKQTPGVRLVSGRRTSVNPFTSGEMLSPANPGDTEVFHPETGAWELRFGWLTPERISIAWKPDFDQPDSPVREAACRLAHELNADVVGDDGETYTLP